MHGSPDLYGTALGLVVLLFAIVFHECAHGFVADRFGDPTARHEGRLTLNPIPHIDPFGTILLPVATMFFGGMMFGYAKPVPVNTTNLRNPRWDSVWIAVAGPCSNFLLALLASVAYAVFIPDGFGIAAGLGDKSFAAFLQPFLVKAIQINLLLGVFNLIPIPPLDGSWILLNVLPLNLAIRYSQIRQYGFLILFALMWTRVLSMIMGPPFTLLLGICSAIASL